LPVHQSVCDRAKEVLLKGNRLKYDLVGFDDQSCVIPCSAWALPERHYRRDSYLNRAYSGIPANRFVWTQLRGIRALRTILPFSVAIAPTLYHDAEASVMEPVVRLRPACSPGKLYAMGKIGARPFRIQRDTLLLNRFSRSPHVVALNYRPIQHFHFQ
jgi:hypothetical protein